jgi:uncharacterized protein (DUF1800 family)
MDRETQTYLAFHRFGLGARRGDWAAVAADPRAAVLDEISGPDALTLDNSSLPSSHSALSQFFRDREAAAEQGRGKDADPPRIQTPVLHYYLRELEARFSKARSSKIGFGERLVSFWSNHFAVESNKNAQIRILSGCFERESIRPHVFGRFHDMLLSVVKHPAMLIYLDNHLSIGPNSKAGVRLDKGLNENLAREIMELHTIGVDGGYTQTDVTNFAKVLTGWTVAPWKSDPQQAGRFIFVENRHEPGAKRVLGRDYAMEGMAQGAAVLSDLADYPATARHIARKLATAFVSDVPSEFLIGRLSKIFLDTDGDLAAVARELVQADESWDAPIVKIRTPREYIVAAVRALDVELDSSSLLRSLRVLGEEPWNPPSPQGFGLTTSDWLAPDALTNRLDFAELIASRADAAIDPRELAAELLGGTVSRETHDAIARAESRRQGLSLLLMSPEFQRR